MCLSGSQILVRILTQMMAMTHEMPMLPMMYGAIRKLRVGKMAAYNSEMQI